MSAEEDSPFGNLPVEMKSKLFTFLDIKSRKNARFVCRSWRPIATETLIFQGVVTDQTEQWIWDSGYQLKSLALQNLTKPIQMSAWQKAFPQVQEYTIGRGLSTRNILHFFRYIYCQIQRLTILNMALSSLKVGSMYQFEPQPNWLYPKTVSIMKSSNLSSLSLTLKSEGIVKTKTEDFKKHFQAVKEILRYARIKTLKTFTIKIHTGRGREFKKPWNVVFGFILDHWESLRELKLALFGEPVPRDLYSPDYFYMRSLGEFRKLKLEKFCAEFDVYHGKFVQALSLQMDGCENLELEGDLRLMSKKNIEIEDDKYFAKTLKALLQSFNPEYMVRLRASTLKIFRYQSHYISLGWAALFNHLETIELKVIGLRVFDVIPFFPVLKRFSLISAQTPSVANFGTFLIDRIVQRMPNVEELEIIFPETLSFEIHHVQDLQDLQKLKLLTIGKIPMDDTSFELYCETPGLSFSRKNFAAMPELSVNVPFECAVIQIDHTKDHSIKPLMRCSWRVSSHGIYIFQGSRET